MFNLGGNINKFFFLCWKENFHAFTLVHTLTHALARFFVFFLFPSLPSSSFIRFNKWNEFMRVCWLLVVVIKKKICAPTHPRTEGVNEWRRMCFRRGRIKKRSFPLKKKKQFYYYYYFSGMLKLTRVWIGRREGGRREDEKTPTWFVFFSPFNPPPTHTHGLFFLIKIFHDRFLNLYFPSTLRPLSSSLLTPISCFYPCTDLSMHLPQSLIFNQITTTTTTTILVRRK